MRKEKKSVFYKVFVFKQAIDIWKKYLEVQLGKEKKTMKREEYENTVIGLGRYLKELKKELRRTI
jgi:hypothetical protein